MASEPFVQCDSCESGEVWTECCNGSSGCECQGRQVFFGVCQVCEGTMLRSPSADTQANIKAIRHMATLTGGYFGNPHGRLR